MTADPNMIYPGKDLDNVFPEEDSDFNKLSKWWETEVIRLRALNADLLAALIWCSGSPDFNEGGQARDGWVKLCRPLIDAALAKAGEDNNG